MSCVQGVTIILFAFRRQTDKELEIVLPARKKCLRASENKHPTLAHNKDRLTRIIEGEQREPIAYLLEKEDYLRASGNVYDLGNLSSIRADLHLSWKRAP